MNWYKSRIFIILLVHSALQAHGAWTPKDSIELPYYATMMGVPESISGDDRYSCFRYSPDGRHVFILRHFGNLGRDVVTYELQILDLRNISDAFTASPPHEGVAPIKIIKYETRSSVRPAISHARWTVDGKGISFLAMDKNGNLQLCRQLLSDDQPKSLTNFIDKSIVNYGLFSTSTTGVSGEDLMLLRTTEEETVPEKQSYPFKFIERHPTLGRPTTRRKDVADGKRTLTRHFIQREGRVEEPLEVNVLREWRLAPDATTAVGEVSSADGGPSPFVATVNLETFRADISSDQDMLTRSEKWQRLRYPPVTDWPTQQLAGISQAFADIELTMRESYNQAPMVIAKRAGKEVVVIPSSVDLKQKGWRQGSEFAWEEDHGKTSRGILILPGGSTKQLPLVVQVEGTVRTSRFRPDGSVRGGFAAQQFASRGYAVLRVEMVPPDSNEGPAIVKRLDGAISRLIADKVVDPRRVGIIGHSRTGYQVHYALSHPGRIRFAAAIVDDAFTGTYSASLKFAAIMGFPMTSASWVALKGGPFWEKKAEWLEHDITFNADRVRTPILFTPHVGLGNEREFETLYGDVVGAYTATGNAIEVAMFPQAAHTFQRPREIAAIMTLASDWMDFWLMGRSPIEPSIATRWAILEKQQGDVLKLAPPPRGKWVFVPEGVHGGSEAPVTNAKREKEVYP